MSNEITKKEKDLLFRQVRTLLGEPVREVEINDPVMEDLLTIAIEEYSSYINDWLIQQQWGTLQNLNIESNDIVFALTTKTLDFEKSFTYAYSKQAGMGTNSPWELKRDYVIISANTQFYTIPAGREINEVLWVLPPQLFSSNPTLGNLSPINWSSNAYGWDYMGTSANAVLPASSLYMFTQDIKMKKMILQSDLTYRITGGPKGTKILHLYPIPGSRDEITGRYGKTLEGSYVWYWYYDVNEKERNECLEENNDIIKLPNDVPINNIPWGKLNTSSKTKVRRLLIAKAKNFLASTRGKFSGKLKDRNGQEVNLDYSFLLDQARVEEDKVYEELTKYLEKITYRQLMEDKAAIATSLNEVMKQQPPTQPLFMI